MKSVYRNHIHPHKVTTKIFTDGFKKKVIEDNTFVSENPFIEGKTREILLDGIKVNMRSGKITPPLTIDVEHDFPFLKIHFEIEGSSIYTPKNDKSVVVNIPGGHYNFFFLPEVNGTLRYDKPNRKTLEILFTKEYLKRVFGTSFKKDCSEFGIALEHNLPFVMWENSKPITPQLHRIINEVITCDFSGGLKKAYLESKITEILAIFFNRLKNKNSQHSESICKDDYLKIIHAETILREHIKNPFTIAQLAIVSGINQFKLKKHFKLIFGKPIFSYVTDLRMEKAKSLIVNEGFTIAEAAYEIGYKNPQHFTVAFKKVYNFLPSSLKKD
ncbi:helix-turn-helix transcriptional regulator [Cellulophaga sp. HaHaR_3_176]|uniref:helix-turn-helix domain-containing protein n=1 Tax=Cellulophaga sp. HaHaR_3_176 TaxID=1942464 RepID=UPI001C1FB4C5|nr:AraC family transcriptional regulator [Cellulophaga sp. HaHaR_3_176]QWX83914.1 helix-turn-helix transcriptional regulator [Cellulophaga sp. HaHaR_3_176]